MSMSIGKKIKELRETRGVSQRAVSIATGLTENTLSTIERGENKNPTINTVKAIADYYGIPVSELIGE